MDHVTSCFSTAQEDYSGGVKLVKLGKAQYHVII